MNKKIIVTLAMLGMAFGSLAQAALTVEGSVGGSPTGVFKVNFDDLALGSTGGVSTTPNGFVQVSFTGDGGVVQGETVDYARPVLSGGNGLGFDVGGTTQPNGEDNTPYLITGLGSVTLTFNAPQTYLGLLWGSVDASNTLTFYSGDQVVGTVTGADVLASPNGDQGVLGTIYVNIVSTLPFDRVVATTGVRTFEFDNVAYNPTNPDCSGCVRTQGYWKTHAEFWSMNALFLGDRSYTQQELLAILATPVKGNGLIALAHQLIATKLNLAEGACATAEVSDAVAQADLLIGSLKIKPSGGDSLPASATSSLVSILDEYNNGLAIGGPGHCD